MLRDRRKYRIKNPVIDFIDMPAIRQKIMINRELTIIPENARIYFLLSSVSLPKIVRKILEMCLRPIMMAKKQIPIYAPNDCSRT